MRRLSAILLCLCALSLAAQQMEWSVDFSTVLNNREGGDGQCPDQTMFFTRLAPEAGLSLMDGSHVLRGGVAWYQPMIDNLQGYKVLPTLYYRYNHPWGLHLTVGLLPRSLMVRRMPRYLWSDSLNYCQPNLRGAMVQVVRPGGYAELAIDWRQLQTRNRRESFAAMLNADWRVAGPLGVGGHVQYNHLATRRDNDIDGVNDDFTVNPMLSLDLSRRTVLDSLRLEAGAIVQWQRDRHRNQGWEHPAGFVANATLQWRWLQLDEAFFAGKDLFPLYPQYGSLLNMGDPYYRSKVYSRTDLTVHVVHTRFVDLSGSLMFHATDRVTGFWQQITCRFYIDNVLWQHRRDKDYLRSPKLPSIY